MIIYLNYQLLILIKIYEKVHQNFLEFSQSNYSFLKKTINIKLTPDQKFKVFSIISSSSSAKFEKLICQDSLELEKRINEEDLKGTHGRDTEQEHQEGQQWQQKWLKDVQKTITVQGSETKHRMPELTDYLSQTICSTAVHMTRGIKDFTARELSLNICLSAVEMAKALNKEQKEAIETFIKNLSHFLRKEADIYNYLSIMVIKIALKTECVSNLVGKRPQFMPGPPKDIASYLAKLLKSTKQIGIQISVTMSTIRAIGDTAGDYLSNL